MTWLPGSALANHTSRAHTVVLTGYCLFVALFFNTKLGGRMGAKYNVPKTDKNIRICLVINVSLHLQWFSLLPTPSPARSDSRCSLTLLTFLPPLCQVPLIRTNTHLQPTIEALFSVGTLLIQQPSIKDRDLDHSVSESCLKVSTRCFICGFNNDLISQNNDIIQRVSWVCRVHCTDGFLHHTRLKGREHVGRKQLNLAVCDITADCHYILDTKARFNHV